MKKKLSRNILHLLLLVGLIFTSCTNDFNDSDATLQHNADESEQVSEIMQLLQKVKNGTIKGDPALNRTSGTSKSLFGCDCLFEIASTDFSSLPESSYWISTISYTNTNGQRVGPFPIGNAGVFPTSVSFSPQTPSDIEIEFGYDPGPTYPGGDVTVSVNCTTYPGNTYTWTIPNGFTGTIEDSKSDSIDSECSVEGGDENPIGPGPGGLGPQ